MSRSARRHSFFAITGVCALAALSLSRLPGQPGFTLSAARLEVRTVVQGVIPDGHTISVSGPAGTQWNASVQHDPASDPAWLVLNGGNGPLTGSGTGSFQVGIRPWIAASKAAGTYTESVTLTPANGAPVNLAVTWTVLPRSPDPVFRSLAGPVGCQKTRDSPDLDTCTVPNEWPTPMTPPARGASYRDPNFGATVRVLSDPDCAHAYSTPSAVSAGNSYVLIWCSNGPRVVDAKSGQEIYKPPAHDRSARWDARNDSVYYFMAGPAIQKVDVGARKVSTLIDYSKDVHRFTSIQSGGTGDTSKDNLAAVLGAERAPGLRPRS